MALSCTLRSNIYLIGTEANQILGCKLPSNKQVLQVLFYNMRCVKLNLHESSRLVISEVLVFWQKARIPYRETQHCICKLEALYKEWRNLQKHCKRKTLKQEQNERNFKDKLENLFDIAHANALDLIKIEEDKQFLLCQRQEGRVGTLGGIDKQHAEKEERTKKRLSQEEERQKKFKRDSTVDKVLDTEEISEKETSSENETEDSACTSYQVSPPEPPKRGTKCFITTKLVAALDKCKLSDRDSVHILMATAEALGLNTKDLVINRSSIRRYRQKLREERALAIKSNHKELQLEFAVVHWDGKLLPEISEKEKVDRLPVIISGNGKEYLLGVPKLASGSGADIAAGVYEMLTEHQFQNKIEALCCDTTASNTGRINGACVLLEQKLNKDLLYLPCRHHIYELVLKSAFEACLGVSSGPEGLLFKRFHKAWINIDISKFSIGIEDQFVMNAIGNDRESILQFVKGQVAIRQVRDDYKELLQLVIIFLGGYETQAIKFHSPGAFHHARWMAKAIYCLKIFLFRNVFTLTPQEFKGVRDMCIFIVKIYIKPWYNAPLASLAPSQDLRFLKDLYYYSEVNERISQVTIKTFSRHLWYLTEETVAFAFFDDSLCINQKVKMSKAFLGKEANTCELKRLNVHLEDMQSFIHKELHHFVSKRTSKFFERCNISSQFIAHDPATWKSRPDYQQGSTIIPAISVINDTAERGVKLMEEYNNLLTQNEEQKQYLLKVVKDYRAQFPSCSKYTLSKEC